MELSFWPQSTVLVLPNNTETAFDVENVETILLNLKQTAFIVWRNAVRRNLESDRVALESDQTLLSYDRDSWKTIKVRPNNNLFIFWARLSEQTLTEFLLRYS